jgi:hypothetical protein
MHFMVPWFDRPIIYDVRAKPVNIQSVSGSKDLQTVGRNCCSSCVGPSMRTCMEARVHGAAWGHGSHHPTIAWCAMQLHRPALSCRCHHNCWTCTDPIKWRLYTCR